MKKFSAANKSTPLMASTVAQRTRIMWCMRLHSAFRTAMACTIVGVATIYGPKIIVNQIKFVAFSYLTAVLIVSDAALGDTIRGCWHALCATAQVVPLAMVVRWIIDPKPGLPISMAALVVVVASFLVALPECTHLTAKRIAFGQIVLVCTDAVVSRDGSGVGFMHPLHVAASTALGASASLLALLLPFPWLACYKVRELYRIYAESASERMDLYMRAFKSKDNQKKMELVTQAKPIAETGTKLMQSIEFLQEGLQWERPWSIYLKPNISGLGDKLQSMELPMRGIDYSLGSSPDFPVQVVDQERISNVLDGMSIQLQQKINQAIQLLPLNSVTEQEPNGKPMEQKHFLPLKPILGIDKYNWVLFFFSCIDMLLNDSTDAQTQEEKIEFRIKGAPDIGSPRLPSNERLEFAFKCSISLGLAVLFGLIFDKENGCWAGLTIAISFVTGRQAVFTIANTRAQGTAIGSAYGVIGCFLFHHAEARLLALLPWIIFTSFLRHSQMYGQTGGFSAAIGALLILGRKHYGAPNEFAIVRLAEVFIGLSCFIAVELFLQPTRAATLAKSHLCLTLQTLQGCMKQTGFHSMRENRDEQRFLKSLVFELKKLVTDAELEPDFWFLPFRTTCYRKLVGSLSNIVDMLRFITINIERLSELPESCSNVRKEFQAYMNCEFESFQEALGSLLKCLYNTNSFKSQADSQEPMDEMFSDLEVGKLQTLKSLTELITEDEAAKMTTEEMTTEEEEEEKEDENKKKLRERMAIYIGAMEFCISSLRKEIDETQICVKEINQWENHSSK